MEWNGGMEWKGDGLEHEYHNKSQITKNERSKTSICDHIFGNGSKLHMKYSVFLHVFTDISSYAYIFNQYLCYHFSNSNTELHVLCLNIKYCCCGTEKYIENKMCDLD